MAKRQSTNQGESLDLYGEQVAAPDSLRDIENLFDTLTIAQLRTVRVLADKKRKAKLEVSDHRGSSSQAIDFERVKTRPTFATKIENTEKSNT